eukprot:TRINITY_DN8013_c0_g1_i1.p1 TRINITY_DN8013_c0_g1~~TRINITY_DN8013_c0_g1_i1.p1  ORF type:complete len:589 (-),score=151.64 TRINITY_DN8013_c0_g1_i1:144-1910(-)
MEDKDAAALIIKEYEQLKERNRVLELAVVFVKNHAIELESKVEKLEAENSDLIASANKANKGDNSSAQSSLYWIDQLEEELKKAYDSVDYHRDLAEQLANQLDTISNDFDVQSDETERLTHMVDILHQQIQSMNEENAIKEEELRKGFHESTQQLNQRLDSLEFTVSLFYEENSQLKELLKRENIPLPATNPSLIEQIKHLKVTLPTRLSSESIIDAKIDIVFPSKLYNKKPDTIPPNNPAKPSAIDMILSYSKKEDGESTNDSKGKNTRTLVKKHRRVPSGNYTAYDQSVNQNADEEISRDSIRKSMANRKTRKAITVSSSSVSATKAMNPEKKSSGMNRGQRTSIAVGLSQMMTEAAKAETDIFDSFSTNKINTDIVTTYRDIKLSDSRDKVKEEKEKKEEKEEKDNHATSKEKKENKEEKDKKDKDHKKDLAASTGKKPIKDKELKTTIEESPDKKTRRSTRSGMKRSKSASSYSKNELSKNKKSSRRHSGKKSPKPTTKESPSKTPRSQSPTSSSSAMQSPPTSPPPNTPTPTNSATPSTQDDVRYSSKNKSMFRSFEMKIKKASKDEESSEPHTPKSKSKKDN